jgi:hypothetical protein
VTAERVKKILGVIDAGLISGLGEAKPGHMCVQAAINFADGKPHGDKLECEASFVGQRKIRLNDAAWSSNSARTAGMKRLAIAGLGSLSVNRRQWFKYIAEQRIRRVLPVLIGLAIARFPKEADALNALSVRCRDEGTREAAIAVRDKFRGTAAAAYAAAADRDRILQLEAEITVEACIACETEGSKWLDLVS